MPLKGVFVPFDDGQLLGQGYKIAKDNGADGCLTLQSSLEKVTDTLIVVAHSAQNTGLLFNTPGTGSVSPAQLVKMLKDKGFRAKHIQIFACEAGHSQNSLGGAGSFDTQLAKLLPRIGVMAFSSKVASHKITGKQMVLPQGYKGPDPNSPPASKAVNRKAVVIPGR